MAKVVREIIGKGSLLEVAQGYGIIFKKTGNSFKARCPFHSERTPSFFVNPGKNIFHCFGCNKAGNIISFVAEIEKISIEEAVRKLAAKLGIKTGYDAEDRISEGGDLLLEFAKFLHNILKKDGKERAYNYLIKRGVSEEFIDKYLLGYAPRDYSVYEKFISKKEGLVNYGIFGEDGSNIYPMLRDRVVFPIYDFLGRVVAFGGRKLEEGDDSPKYLNTRENRWFEKRSIFYGHPGYIDDISREGMAIIVEGYFDQILLNQYGFPDTLGILGSVFSSNHVNFLERYVKKVYFYFDEDEAGQKSAVATLDTILNASFESYFLSSQMGMDPSDIVVRYGREKLESMIKDAKSLFEFYCGMLKKKIEGTSNIDEKARYIDEGIRKIALINNQIKRELYLSRFSEIIGMNIRVLEERLNTIVRLQSKGYNIFYTQQVNSVDNRALLELEAEILFMISKDLDIRKKCESLKIKDYIITPFYRDLYERITKEEGIHDNWLELTSNEEDCSKYLSYIYKFEYLDNYEISSEKLMEVFTNLKVIVTNSELDKVQSEQLDRAIQLKKELLGLHD